MMNWNDNGGNGWWPLMCLMTVIVVGVAIWAGITLLRRTPRNGSDSGQQILDQRLARGEISVAEFEERRAAMTTTGRGPTEPDHP
jgi:uncharacterized membrane protein